MPPTIAISGMYQGLTQPVPLPAPPYAFDSEKDIFVVIKVLGSGSLPTLIAEPRSAFGRKFEAVEVSNDCETSEGRPKSDYRKKFPANSLDADTEYTAIAAIVDSAVSYTANQVFSTLP